MESNVAPAEDDCYRRDEAPKRKASSQKDDVDHLCTSLGHLSCSCPVSSSGSRYTDDTASTQTTTGQKRKAETPDYDEVRLKLTEMRYELCKLAEEVNVTFMELATCFRWNGVEHLKMRYNDRFEFDVLREDVFFAEYRLHDRDNAKCVRLAQKLHELSERETRMLEQYCKYFKDHEDILKDRLKSSRQEHLESVARDGRSSSRYQRY